ncbi:hypothetical protein [Thiothrix eikelboomii]|uniref:Uncharacterized protein n=1 Tax=Thiothrix eikelboomii TaxID=92487 RepID=A0A1T4VTH5_9GAMM|nr:hypothetical protein [Thiothrix eikelboomii]SKA68300.1 hypothetical protein SAMN02745130_00241 [Thiothrix eikelboomii]
MKDLIAVAGVLLLLLGVSALVIGAARYFFPSLEQYFPESFKKPLSFQYGSYYFLAGLLCLLWL